MKLSKLIALANGQDPEILVVEDSGEGWEALPLEERAPFPLLREGRLLIAAATNAEPILSGEGDLTKRG